MEKVTFTSKSKQKINLLIQVAKEMGIKASKEYEIADEEMGIPGAKFTEEQFDKWLAKDDGDAEYTTEQVLKHVKGNLAKKRKEIKSKKEREITDEEMGVPGNKPTAKQIDAWLAKGDGEEEYTTEEMLAYVKGNLAKNRKKRAA
jgi:hypothetical protein